MMKKDGDTTGWRSHTILVTGGSRGIGAATVEALAARGARVVFSYLQDAAAAESLCSRLRASGGAVHAVQGDVADADFAARILDEAAAVFGIPTGLVNNAGITGHYGPFASLPDSALRRTLDVNVLGTLLLSREMVRRWQAQRIPGRMVNISSIAATLGAAGEYVHYAASKAAIDAFTIGLARELGAAGIRVNAVAPGTALTDIHAAAGVPDRPARVAGRVPMGRVAEAQEIAEAVAWLLSDQASYVTGSILRVSGGL